MAAGVRSCVVRLGDTEARMSRSADGRSVVALQRASLDVKLTLPARPNVQTPHAQDEIYLALRGRGVLIHDGKRDEFEAGDFLFVAAGVEHHFENASDDLLCWRVFYGPSGGEPAGAE